MPENAPWEYWQAKPAPQPDSVPSPWEMWNNAPVQAPPTLARQTVEEPADTPEQPKPSYLLNTLPDMVAQGLTFGLSDEMEAGLKTGAGLWGDYGQELESVRDRMNQGREEYPVGSMAAEIGGGVLIPGGALRSGGTMAARAGKAAMAGAGYGGAYGFGTGEGAEDRAKGAAGGALIGGAAGAVAPVIATGIGKAGGAIGRKFGDTYRKIVDPERAAQTKVGRALADDARIGEDVLNPAEYAAAQSRGQPVMPIDRGATKTRDLGRAAADLSDEGRAIFNREIDARFEGQGPRVSGYLRKIVGDSNATNRLERLQADARRARRPLYRKAHRDGSGGVMSDEIERLMGSDDVVAAMRNVATKSGKNRAIADGLGGFNSKVKVTPDGRIEFGGKAGGPPAYPDLQFWDYVKRDLDDQVNSLFRAGRNDEGAALSIIRNSLRDELDRMVPSYKEARGVAAKFFDAEDALDAGRKFVSSNKPIAEARKAIDKMSDAEKALFREGYTSDLLDKIAKTGDRRDVVKAIFGSAQAREKMEVALGKSRARDLEAFLHVETVMDRARNAIQGNSKTARYLADAAALGVGSGGAMMAGGSYSDPTTVAAGIAALLTRRGASAVGSALNRRVAERIAKLLVSDAPDALEKATKQVARHGKLLDAMRHLDLPLTIGATQQGTQAIAAP